METEEVNGHSYMSPIVDPLAVPGMNVNKT